jgi:hypothetical protein
VTKFSHICNLQQACCLNINHNTIHNRAGVERMNDIQSLQRTASSLKDRTRLIPKSIVIRVKINGHTVKALVDSGSTADIISSA